MAEGVYIVSWLLLAAIFIIIEIISLGLTTIWFAGGAFVAALAALAGASFPIQIILFVIVSVGLLLGTRPFAKRFLDSRMEKTNAEALVGCEALVIEEVDNLKEMGKAKINGMEWTARAKDPHQIIPVGTSATVVEIQGVKLILEANIETTSTSSSTTEVDDIQIV